MHNNVYVPPVYSFLSEDEWQVMEEWFMDTDMRYGLGAAPSVPRIVRHLPPFKLE